MANTAEIVIENPKDQTRAFVSFTKDTGKSFDPKTRTATVVFASESMVLVRDDYGDPFYEILSCKAEHFRSARMDAGVALLNNHRNTDKDDVIGKAKNPVFKDNLALADIKLSMRKSLDELAQDIDDGIIDGISHGYRVFRYLDVTPENAAMRVWLAIDWETFEVSIVPVQADINGRIRSLDTESKILTKPNEMAGITTEAPATGSQPTVTAPAATPAANVATVETVDVPGIERTRSLEIFKVGTQAKISAEVIEQHIKDGSPLDKFRSYVIDHLTGEQTKPATGGTVQAIAPNVIIVKDVVDKTRALMEIGLGRKLGVIEDKDITRDEIMATERYRSMAAMDYVRDWMIESNVQGAERLTNVELSKRALVSSSSSDFPILLEGTARRVLLKEYQILADTWKELAIIGSVGDFREYKRVRGGTLGDLLPVLENGEYTNYDIPDGAFERISVTTWGRTLNLTRVMLVNDDLGAFTGTVKKMGRSAARTIEKQFYNMIALNGGLGPVMQDGLTLFHATHGNIVTSAPFSSAAVTAMKLLLGKQKDLSGNDFLDLKLDTLLVPTELADAANLLNESQYDATPNIFQKPNVSRGVFKKIVDTQRLPNATQFYGFADKNIEPVFEVAFLNGNQTPYLEQREEFDVDGIRWKIRHDFGMAAIGFKGGLRNAGV